MIQKTRLAVLGLAACALAAVPAARAANVIKAGTGTDLNAAASWSGGNTPTLADVAAWDNSSLGAGLTLGANTNWLGVSVSGALSDIAVTGAGVLTVGGSGFDLSAAPVNMTLANAITLGASQIWNVNSGRVLQVGRIINSPFTLTKAGTGTLTLGSGGASTLNGTLNLQAGTVQIGVNDLYLDGLTGSGTIENGSGDTRWMFVSNSTDNVFDGIMRNGAGGGLLGFVKRGAGTLTLNNSANVFGDMLNIDAGRLVLNNAGTYESVATWGAAVVNGVLDINGATVRYNRGANPWDSSLNIGSGSGLVGALHLTSGTLTTARQIGVGTASGSYGALTQTGGNVTNAAGFLALGLGTGQGVLNVNGGTFIHNGPATIGAGAGGIGVVNVAGNAVFNNGYTGTDFPFWVGEGGQGVLNVMGNALATISGVNLVLGQTDTAVSTVNLLGGTLSARQISKVGAAAVATLNFDGGTLKATAANANFLTGLTGLYIHDDGATIDDGGFAVTVGQQLMAPSGSGVTSIPVTAGGSGYVDSPLVLVTNIDGSGLTAIAQIDYAAGTVTNILVTNPGNDYFTPPTVALSGGGGTGATLGTPVLGLNSSGGLTKSGAGTLTLSGGSTYTGPTRVLGGTLALNPGATYYMSTDLTVSNATLRLELTGGSGSLSPNTLVLDGSAALEINYGTVTANPFSAALSLAGPVSVVGGSKVINIEGIGLAQGVLPLITSSTAINAADFVLGSLPPGIKAVLINSTSTSLDLQITEAGQLLTWHGANADNTVLLTNWDINNSVNWYDTFLTPSRYQQYAANTYGDNVIFGDQGYSTDGTNYVNLPVTVVPATVTFSSSLNTYVLSGPGGISGATSVVVTNNTAAIIFGTSNSYTGGTVVSGGTLAINSDSALGAASGGLTMFGGALEAAGNVTNSRAISVAGNASLGAAAGRNLQLNGALSGAGQIAKTGAGTLTLAGLNTQTGAIRLNSGKLNLTGTATPDTLTVGGSASATAMLEVSGNLTSKNLFVGNESGAVGVVYQTGGTVSLAGGTGDTLNVGNWDSTFGYYNAAGGVLNVSGISIGGENNPNVWPPQGSGDGILEVNGATINNDGWIVLARGGGPNTGILNMFSGSLTYAGGGIGCNWQLTPADNQTSIINLMGGSITSTNQGVNFRTENTGIVNLKGGLLQGTSITGPGTLNFNGGTLRPATAFTNPFLDLESVYVHPGGAIIDDNGLVINIAEPLLAPPGSGITGIASLSGGTGYIAPPIVTIAGDGTGATAIAQINPVAGVVTNILITCPGVNYTTAPTITLTGGGATTAATATAAVPTANISGGFTKIGAGTLTLAGTNTYTGLTTVSTGELFLTPAHQAGGPVTVADGAKFGVSSSSATAPSATIGALTMGGSGATTLDFSYGFAGNPVNAALQAGAVTINGTCTIRLGGNFAAGIFPLLKYSSLSSIPALSAPRGVAATLSNHVAGSTLYVVISSVSPGIVWTGTNSVSPNLWDLNTTVNWLTGTTPTTYMESVPPGDAVIFNDVGSGVVLLSNTVSPLSVTISNNIVNYSLRGSGSLAGTMGLTKQGTGAATNALVNSTYTGPTVINGGNLVVSGGSAIGDLSAVTLANAPGVNLTVSGSETIGSLAGGGSVVLNANLTMGMNNSNTVFGGTATGSGLFATRGTGTLTVTGAVNTTGEVWVGSGSGDASVLNIGTGATVSAGNWFVVGRSGSTGTININGGTLIHSGSGNLTLGTLGTTPSGTINLNSGSISNLVGDTFLGEGSSAINYGYYNQSGGYARLGSLVVGRGSGTSNIGRGAANVSGGTLDVNNLEIGYANSANAAKTGTNTFTLSGGAVVNASGHVRLAFAGPANLWGMLTNNGGILNVGGAALYVGYWDPCSGVVALNSGQINLRSNTSIVLGQNSNNSGTSTFDQAGGAVTFYSDSGTTVGGTGSLNLCNAGSGTYTYNLSGGTLTVPQVRKAGGTGNGLFNFNGGRLVAAASSATFMQGLTAATIQANGAIIDSSSHNITIGQALVDDGTSGSLVKLGAGTLALSGANTYLGNTIVSNGTLLVNGSIAGSATVKSGATLGGIGTIGGVVTVEPGGSIGAGESIGNLTLNSSPVLNGTVIAEVDRNGGAPLADLISVVGNINYGGTLMLKNIGAPLQAGDTFTLFSGSGYSGSFALVAQTPGQVVTWDTANLAVNGTISVQSVISAEPPNIGYSFAGGVLSLTWPSEYLGWILQVQTNNLSVGLSNNWVTVPGSGSATSANIPVSTGNPAVFYRLTNTP